MGVWNVTPSNLLSTSYIAIQSLFTAQSHGAGMKVVGISKVSWLGCPLPQHSIDHHGWPPILCNQSLIMVCPRSPTQFAIRGHDDDGAKTIFLCSTFLWLWHCHHCQLEHEGHMRRPWWQEDWHHTGHMWSWLQQVTACQCQQDQSEKIMSSIGNILELISISKLMKTKSN